MGIPSRQAYFTRLFCNGVTRIGHQQLSTDEIIAVLYIYIYLLYFLGYHGSLRWLHTPNNAAGLRKARFPCQKSDFWCNFFVKFQGMYASALYTIHRWEPKSPMVGIEVFFHPFFGKETHRCCIHHVLHMNVVIRNCRGPC